MGYEPGSADSKKGSSVRKWNDGLRQLAMWVQRILKWRLIEWVVSAVVGMVVIWGWGRVDAYRQQTPFHELWDHVLEGADSIPIVIGGIKLDVFTPNGTNRPSRLPKNVLLVGVDDGVGMSLLRESFARAFGRLKVTLHQPQDFGDNILKSFVSVGGPSVNSVTGGLLANVTGIQMFYPEHYAMVGQEKLSAEQDRQGNVTKDFGFIIIAPNPLAQIHHVCVVFGIWPYGTSAALEALSKPDLRNRLFQQFTEKIKLRSPVLLVLETKVEDLQHGAPNLIEVRDLTLK